MFKIGPYELNQIYTGDARELSKAIPDESIDLVVTSPPYNLGNRYANQTEGAIQGKWSRVIQYDEYQDNMTEADYREWQQSVIMELWRAIKPTGAIYYNHKPRIQDGVLNHRFDLIPSGVTIRQIVIWKRPKGHNFNKGYFVPSYEWVFILAKPDYELSPGFAGYSDVWEFPPAANNPHPAPFPIGLPLRAIDASRGCKIVLDPFSGSGTTAMAAIMAGCDYIGFELIERWAEKSRRDLLGVRPLIVPIVKQAQQAVLL